MTDPEHRTDSVAAEATGASEVVAIRPYPSPAVPIIAAAGALMTLAALGIALTELEPYTWALAPFLYVFAALPYFAIAVRARRAVRPISQLILAVTALVMVGFGGFVYFVDVIAAQGTISAGTFITVPLWQTLPAALAVGSLWWLEPKVVRPTASDEDAEQGVDVDDE
jgi:hypothetical protein